MSITHDNHGTRRTQAQREAAALIERGEFIAADTPAGQAVIDALPEAARLAEEARGRDMPRPVEPKQKHAITAQILGVTDMLTIHSDRDAMRREIQRVMGNAVMTSFLDSSEPCANIRCLAVVSYDSINIEINVSFRGRPNRTAVYRFSASGIAGKVLSKHNGMRARLEALVSRLRIESEEVA